LGVHYVLTHHGKTTLSVRDVLTQVSVMS
jgi:hypothetical protein